MLDPRVVASIPYQEDHSNAVCYSNNVMVYASPDVFYELIIANYPVDFINISLCGSTFDTYLSILNTDGEVEYFNDDYGPCAPQSELTFPTNEHDTLYVVVQGWDDNLGDYSIAINDGDLVSLSNFKSSDIRIFPNPTSGSFTFVGVYNIQMIHILGMNGKLVKSIPFYNGEEIDVSYLEKGIYLVQLESDGENISRKLIID